MLVHENLKENLQILKDNGYQYIIKAQDKFLSCWGRAGNRKHIQLIACYNREELGLMLQDLHKDRNFIYIHTYRLSYENCYKNILSVVRHYSWTLRDDWTRHLQISTK